MADATNNSESPKNKIDETREEPKHVDLGKYNAGEGSEKLDQDQILGIGGGTLFYEIIDVDGTAKKHIAMPVLLRDREIVKNLLKGHAQNMIDIQNTIEKAEDEEVKDGSIANRLEEIEERDINILLKVAYYTFKRCDSGMRGRGIEEGVEYIKNWIDTKQLRNVPDVAMGLNRFSPLMGTARR